MDSWTTWKCYQCLLSIIQIKTLTVFWRKNPLRRVSVINWKQLVQFCLAVGCSLVSGNERADFACLDPQYISSYVYTVAEILKSCPRIIRHQVNYQKPIYREFLPYANFICDFSKHSRNIQLMSLGVIYFVNESIYPKIAVMKFPLMKLL